ncbi:hypothetical protein [Salinisphaera sp. T31B1]|uniref:hypothetical protein n=1 Tax=Salinisphaera sp. T31B1 TaxID=727963 RepID=UPI00333F7068
MIATEAMRGLYSGVMVNKAVQMLFVAGCVAALSACSSTPDCMKPQSYMNAKSFPPLKSPAGLDVPPSDPNMQIPDVASGPVGTYDDVPTGVDPKDPAARCLSTPPPMASR